VKMIDWKILTCKAIDLHACLEDNQQLPPKVVSLILETSDLLQEYADELYGLEQASHKE
jgi:hypothetical protein